jgi:hypothetical protein
MHTLIEHDPWYAFYASIHFYRAPWQLFQS